MNLSLNTEEFVGLISWFNIYPATRLPSEGVQSNPAEGVQSNPAEGVQSNALFY